MNETEYKEVMVSMDDEYFSGCINELEESLSAGWKIVDHEYDQATESSLITMEKNSYKI